MISKTLTVLVLISAFHLGGISSWAPAQSSPPRYYGSEPGWDRLVFKSDNFLGSVTTRIAIEELASDAVRAGLLKSPRGVGLEPAGAKVLLLTIDSTIDPLFGSDELVATRVWFSPQEASALQRIRLRRGKEKWKKTYRWTSNGVYRSRLRPEDAEEKLRPERWTNREDSFYPYDLEESNCLSVSAPSALLYVVSAAGLSVSHPPRQLCVFNKKQLHLVRFQTEKSRRLKINYLVKSRQEETRRNGKAEVLKVAFTTRSLLPAKTKAEPFSFLGLKGDFAIYIDKVSKIPVQVSGRIPRFGKVDIRLHQVEIGK